MEIDEDTLDRIEKYRNWHEGYLQGYDEAEKKNNFIIEDLMREINQLQAQLSEFKNADGGYIS